MKLASPAFSNGGPIPRAHTCDGANSSPPLRWSDAPRGAESLALIMDDPDAPGGTFVHWVLYNIPPGTRGLPTGIPTGHVVRSPITALQGFNDFHRSGYAGPCPPPGKPHHYHLKLYAVDRVLAVPPGASKTVLLKALQDHVLAEAELVGRYGR